MQLSKINRRDLHGVSREIIAFKKIGINVAMDQFIKTVLSKMAPIQDSARPIAHTQSVADTAATQQVKNNQSAHHANGR